MAKNILDRNKVKLTPILVLTGSSKSWSRIREKRVATKKQNAEKLIWKYLKCQKRELEQ